MKEEGSWSATVVLIVVKIDGCETAGSSLPRFPRASERALARRQ